MRVVSCSHNSKLTVAAADLESRDIMLADATATATLSAFVSTCVFHSATIHNKRRRPIDDLVATHCLFHYGSFPVNWNE